MNAERRIFNQQPPIQAIPANSVGSVVQDFVIPASTIWLVESACFTAIGAAPAPVSSSIPPQQAWLELIPPTGSTLKNPRLAYVEGFYWGATYPIPEKLLVPQRYTLRVAIDLRNDTAAQINIQNADITIQAVVMSGTEIQTYGDAQTLGSHSALPSWQHG